MNSRKPSNASTDARSPAGASRTNSRGPSPRTSPCASSSRSTASGVLPGITEALQIVPPSVWWFAVGIAVMLFAVHAMKGALDMPTVQTSFETKQCVRVINSDGTDGRCDRLPERYHNQWVY